MNTDATNTNPPSNTRTLLKNFLGWIFPGLGLFFFIAFAISPRFVERFVLLFDNVVRVEAHVQSCELIRNGAQRENAVRCALSYDFNGKTYESNGDVWSTQSPFATPASLERVLAEQSALVSRPIEFERRSPRDLLIADQAWLAMPALWALLVPVFVGVFSLLIYLEPSTRIYKRADLELDPATGDLVEINNDRKNRTKRLAAVWSCFIVLLMLSFIYSLSNRLGNIVSTSGFSDLQPVPAQLTDCTHRYHGSRKGHDQIECTFQYRWQGQVLEGQADALDFRFIATDARMDAEVARLKQNADRMAQVDPRHPGYAWVFLSDDWFVPYSWGIFELMQLMLLLTVLPGFLIYFVRRMLGRGRFS